MVEVRVENAEDMQDKIRRQKARIKTNDMIEEEGIKCVLRTFAEDIKVLRKAITYRSKYMAKQLNSISHSLQDLASRHSHGYRDSINEYCGFADSPSYTKYKLILGSTS